MTKTLPLIALTLLAAGCSRRGEVDETGGIYVTRSACPAIAIPVSTGDITVFDPPASRDARAIDVTASITNIRSTCGDLGADVVANATFDVEARRTNPAGARDVVLPYFVTIVRGGDTVIAKRVNRVAIHFNDGQARAQASATGGAVVNRAAATLPQAVVDKLRKRRKASDADASIDPMTAPEIRTAVARASFEMLVGFQLTPDQLQYNATR